MPWYEQPKLVPAPRTLLDKAWNFLAPQYKRFLQITFPWTKSYTAEFHHTMIMQMTGYEGLCEGFNYKVQLISYLGAVELKNWLGKNVGITLSHDHDGERHICGFIKSVKQLSDSDGTVLYEIEVVDALTMLKQRSTWRVFQLMNVVEITEKILFEHGETNPGLRMAFLWKTMQLTKQYPKRSFTLQAGESDHDFLTRLWRQEGICWHYTHDLVDTSRFPQHTLHLTDSPDSFETCAAAEIRYHRDASVAGRDTITHWHGWREQSLTHVHRHQTEYENHSVSSTQRKNPIATEHDADENQFWAHWNLLDNQLDPAHFTDDREHQQQRTENIALSHQYRAKGFEGLSYVRALQAGTTFSLEWNQNIDSHLPQERKFLTTRVHLYARNNLGIEDYQLPKQFQEWAAQSDGNTPTPSEPPLYINRFECVRTGIPVVPHYDPRMVPNVGPLSATVWVRDNEQERQIDDLGRVLVRFPFTLDAEHQNQFYNPHFAAPDPEEAYLMAHSAFIRVMQPWAHNTYGTSFFPRAGEEVVVMFMNNHPDKPFIAGSLYNGQETPTRFHGQSKVHWNMLSGIRSKEFYDWRHNHLFFDDTPKQINTQLHSDHAYSQLTQGYLTSPRGQENAKPRGEGFELRTDQAGAIRTAKGLLISTYERLKAADSQLSREETQALMEQSLALFKELNRVASQAQGLPSDTAAHSELNTQLKNWENGSNTAPNGAGGGAPIITLTAPAGLIQNTPETIATHAGQNIDSIALQHHQFTSGKNTILNAGHGISAFAHTQDIKTIAHQGQWIGQAQHNDAQLDAGQNISIRANGGKVVIQASDEVIIQAGDGTFAKLGNGQLILGTSGKATIHATSHSMTGPETLSTEVFEASNASTNIETLRKYKFSK